MNKLIHNSVAQNIFALFILQGSNYIFPLITFPYLVRVLGKSGYGTLIFCVSLMQFINIFVDYGFNISGTREISVNKNDMRKVNKIYNIILTCKVILVISIGIPYFFIIQFIPFFSDMRTAYYIAFLIIIGNSIFAAWFYQGIESMKYLTYINIFVKMFTTIFIFLLIKDDKDIYIAIFFQTLYYLIPGLISVILVKRKFKMSFHFVWDLSLIKKELDKGKYIFLTNMWIKFYTQGPLIILGFFVNNTAVGNFGIGQKVMSAAGGLIQPVVQAVYPHMCYLYEKSKNNFNLFYKKFYKILFILSIAVSVGLCIFAPQITLIVTGTFDHWIIILTRFFSVAIFLSIMNTVMARILYAMNLMKTLSNSYLYAAIIFFALSIPLTIWGKELGMVLAVILAESTVFLLNNISLLKFRMQNNRV